MTQNEKIIVGSTIVVTASALTLFMLSKKYNSLNKEIVSNLEDIQYTISKTREDIIVGNKEIADGNRILRKIVKQSSEELANVKNV